MYVYDINMYTYIYIPIHVYNTFDHLYHARNVQTKIGAGFGAVS